MFRILFLIQDNNYTECQFILIGLFGSLKLIIELDINFSTCTSLLTICMVQIYIHLLTLTHKIPQKTFSEDENHVGFVPTIIKDVSILVSEILK